MDELRSGVYAIRNKLTGKMYIGSTINLELRWKGHLTNLRCHYSTNPRLQAAWDQDGEAAFEWIVLEEVQPDRRLLLEAEQRWAQRADAGLYNVLPIIGKHHAGRWLTGGARRRQAAKDVSGQ